MTEAQRTSKPVRLSPCPFCGGPPVVFVESLAEGRGYAEGKPIPDDGLYCHAYVFCHECGANGSHTDDAIIYEATEFEPLKREAVRLWQIRDARHIDLYAANDRQSNNLFPRPPHDCPLSEKTVPAKGRWVGETLWWDIGGESISDADLRRWVWAHFPEGSIHRHIGPCILKIHADAYGRRRQAIGREVCA